tara:strand:- start:982 stop:1806 length:825 start_codon:yes stop_codon:yes gene_type:complete
MKKLIFLLCLPIFGFGQVNFPGTEVQLLVGKTIVVNEVNFITESGVEVNYSTYDGFYKNKKLTKIYKKKTMFSSKAEALVNRKFKVIGFKGVENESSNDYILEIENEDIGILYYKYDADYAFNFPFTIEGGVVLPDEYYCKKINEDIDKFTNIKSYLASIRNFKISKLVKSSVSINTIYLHQISFQVKSTSGLVLLLENNLRIDKPEADVEVNVNTSSSSTPFIHSVTVILSDDEAKLLSENNITDYRIGLVDGTMKSADAFVLKKTMQCLIKK